MAPRSESRRRKVKRRCSSSSIGGWSSNLYSPPSMSAHRRLPHTVPVAELGRSHSQSETDQDREFSGHGVDFPESLERAASERQLYHQFEPGETRRLTAYSSLPPSPTSPQHSIVTPPATTPISGSFPPLSPTASSFPVFQPAPFSLWDYLREEIFATDFDSHQELKWERVRNFLNIPIAIEKIIGFGFILCFDSFLYTFTILPIRATLALLRLCTNTLSRMPIPLPPSQKADLLRISLLIAAVVILTPLTDASKIYHSIRGQDTIKLYVIFNALEIADRLCASIGQDIIDCLFSRSTLDPLSSKRPVTAHTFRPLLFFALALTYVVLHTLVMIYQMISLNVAVNSYDYALLTLLMSNQFVEIKGSVFKKFEKDNLFQITCADIVERFTLSLMLIVVAFRNLIELVGTEFDFSQGFVMPKSFGWFRGNSGWLSGNSVLWTISYPVISVMASEAVVDWLKHAFITKFNHIRPSVYERYTDVLCRDLSSGSAFGRHARKHSYVDQSPLVARRLGFASLPLAVLSILIGCQSVSLLFSMHSDGSLWDSAIPRGHLMPPSMAEVIHYAKWIAMVFLFWCCIVVIKIITGVNLVSYATSRRIGMEARAAADVLNDFGRDPIGEGKEEQMYNKELKTLLDDKRDDVPPVAEIGEIPPAMVNGERARPKLEDLTRFTMVKRIW